MGFAMDDAAAMLSDFGVPVVYRGGATVGVLSETITDNADTSNMAREVSRRMLTVVAGTLGVPVRDDPITIDGRAYRIRVRAVDQGEVDDAHEFWQVARA